MKTRSVMSLEQRARLAPYIGVVVGFNRTEMPCGCIYLGAERSDVCEQHDNQSLGLIANTDTNTYQVQHSDGSWHDVIEARRNYSDALLRVEKAESERDAALRARGKICEQAADLVAEAARDAVNRAGIAKGDLDGEHTHLEVAKRLREVEAKIREMK